MYRILTASKDTYITNKIVNNSFRAKDANTGDSGTLDLFKLYNESIISGESNPIEISRLLIKFPIEEITKMDTNKEIDVNDPSFKCHIKLHDVYGGQTTPSNFKILLNPLAKDFNEGIGRDIVKFSDIDSCNFITASIINGVVDPWNIEGAKAIGSLGESSIDAYVSGTLNPEDGVVSLSVEQLFETGKEDLYMDVTRIVSGTVAGFLPNKGFLLTYSGSYETNTNTYFVKRFSSRNTSVTADRPKMIISYDNSIQDYHEDFIFNVRSSLYLMNYHYGNLSNIISGISQTEVSGENCMVLKLETGSYKQTFNVSQALNGRHRMDGVYSASFTLNGYVSEIYDHLNTSGSIIFNEIWSSADESITYLSSSLEVKKENRRTANTKNQNNLLVTVLNVNDEYQSGEKIKVRVFAEDRDRPLKVVKSPFEKKSQIYHEMYFRVRDVFDGSILIDFDDTNNSTRLSTDSDGMFFDLFTDSLPKGRVYSFDFLIKRNGVNTIIRDVAAKFRII